MKWYTYIICAICIFVGAFFGIKLYQEITSESYVNGSIDITNEFTMENFSYSKSELTFYHDDYDTTNTYYFDIDLNVVDDFNGQENTYELWLNDYLLLDTIYNAGSVSSVITMDFYNTNGDLICSPTMNISVKYLSNKTQLTLTTIGNENASFLQQYFSDYGIRIKVIEIL